MLIVTTNEIPGYVVEEVYGEVFGLTVRSRHLGSQMGAGLKSLVGGELKGMTKMLAEGRHEAIARLTQEAEAIGANAVLAMRFDNGEFGGSGNEVCAYGTAVRVRKRSRACRTGAVSPRAHFSRWPFAAATHAGRERGRAVLDQPTHGVDVDVAFDEVGEQIQLPRPHRGDAGVRGDDEIPSRPTRDIGQKAPTVGVVLQQAVPVGADDRTPHTAFRNTGGVAQQRRLSVGDDPAVVNLVAVHRQTADRARRPPQHLRLRERDAEVEQTQPRDLAAPGLHRVVDATAQHLEAAADAEHRSARVPRARR